METACGKGLRAYGTASRWSGLPLSSMPLIAPKQVFQSVGMSNVEGSLTRNEGRESIDVICY
jgi:hypothetical protein